MKPSSAHLLLALFLVVVLILGARLAWVASTTETGWQTLGLSWYNAALGCIGLEREPIGDREPAEQADIWLREVDRVLQAHPDDARIAMGAAWMLDSPGTGFLRKHTQFDSSFRPFIMPKLDHEAIARAVDRFEAGCATRCLELAARATELQPENVDWWRMRALLLFPTDYFYYYGAPAPRRPDWLTTLDECARHDPDNALYDYLAALQLWKTAGTYDWDDNFEVCVLKLDSPDRFAEGVARFDQAQRKKYLAVGQPALPAVAEFLRHARQPRVEEANVGFERHAFGRAQGLVIDLRRWQQARAGTREKDGDPAGALAVWRQQRHVYTQVMSGDDSSGLGHWATMLSKTNIACLQELAKKHPGLISADELAALQMEKENLLLDVRVLTEASAQVGSMVQNRHPLDTPTAGVVTATLQTLSVLLLIVGIIACGLVRWLVKAEHLPPLGTFRHLFAWALGWGLTIFLLGICPAEALGRNVQATIIAAGTCLVGIGMLIIMFRSLVTRCRIWAQGPMRLPVVSIIALITLWQATVAGTCSVIAAAAGPDPSRYSQWYAQPFPSAQQVPSLPLWMLGLALLPTALLAVVLVLVWCVSLLRHKRRTGRFPRAHFVALGLMSLSAVLVLGAFALAPNYLGGHCWPPARGWGGYDLEVWTELVNSPQRPWHWAALQWTAYAGHYVSPGLSLLLVGLWYTARRRRERWQAAPFDQSPGRRDRWGGLIRCLGRSALGMAACCLLVYLAVAPVVLRAVEDDYQRKMTHVRDPRTYWAKIRDAEATIRADPAAMKEIRANVAWELDRYEEQSNDEESEADP